MKQCSKCRKIKLVADFNRYKTSLQGFCRECQQAYQQQNRHKRPQYEKTFAMRHPNSNKERSERYRNANLDKARKASLTSYHKTREANPDEVYKKKRDLMLKRNYGISVSEYDELLQSQNNVCAVCHKPEPWRRGYLHVDHNHKTGQLRGLLCSKCNLALGHANDDVNILRALIRYIQTIPKENNKWVSRSKQVGTVSTSL